MLRRYERSTELFPDRGVRGVSKDLFIPPIVKGSELGVNRKVGSRSFLLVTVFKLHLALLHGGDSKVSSLTGTRTGFLALSGKSRELRNSRSVAFLTASARVMAT